jgi:hypothetical protein
MSWVEHCKREQLRNEEDLRFVETHPEFRIVQTAGNGSEIDATEQYKQGLRNAIDDYREAARQSLSTVASAAE